MKNISNNTYEMLLRTLPVAIQAINPGSNTKLCNTKRNLTIILKRLNNDKPQKRGESRAKIAQGLPG